MRTLDDLKCKYEEYDLLEYYEAMKQYARNSIRCILKKDAVCEIGSSRLGGLPDLPKGTQWFRNEATDFPLSFVCQINFSELKPYDLDNRLPDHGILYVFYDCSYDGMPWGFDPLDGCGKHVYYYAGDENLLARKEAPKELIEEHLVFEAADLAFENEYELPNFESAFVERVKFSPGLSDKYWDFLDDISDDLITKVLGHSDNLQGSMEDECELVTHGIDCGSPAGYGSKKGKELRQNYHRWNLLLQIDSHEELGMMWGDLGRVYLWITDEDLKAKKFDQTWIILQCG